MPPGQGYDTPQDLMAQLQQLQAQQQPQGPPPGGSGLQPQQGGLNLLQLFQQLRGQPSAPQQYRAGGLAGLLQRLAQGAPPTPGGAPGTGRLVPTSQQGLSAEQLYNQGPSVGANPIENLVKNVNRRNAILEELDRQAQGGR